MFSRDNWFDNVEARATPWPGVNWVSVMLIVPDVKKAVEFYDKALGFSVIYAPGENNGQITFARLRYRGINISLNREGAFELDGKAPVTTGHVPPFYIFMYVDNVKEAFNLALSKGCLELEKPTLTFWNDKVGRLQDPFGYIWHLATKCEDK